jgi:hypothetical protein
MRLLLSACVGAMIFSSSCIALDNDAARPHHKSKRVEKVKAFADRITATMAEVSADVLPILGAVGKETWREAQSDAPKIAEELGQQTPRLLSIRKTPQSSRSK